MIHQVRGNTRSQAGPGDQRFACHTDQDPQLGGAPLFFFSFYLLLLFPFWN